MSVTLKFLSEKTGLSITTISLILNNKNVRVSEKNRKLVLETARKYNYIPNNIAKSLATKQTKTIGLIVPDITNIFFAEIAKYIEQEMRKEGYNVFLCNTDDKISEEKKYVNLLYSKGVDGLIICPSIESKSNFKYLEKFINTDKEVIVFDRNYENSPFPYVISDNLNGSIDAVNHLLEKGHRKIGCITGPTSSNSAKLRLEGYKKALTDANINIDENLIRYGNYRFNGGYELGLELLKEDVTAVFISNDFMAYGFYRAAKELNIRIPEDVSVVGYDDLFFSKMLDTPLTSIGQNVKLMAKKVCDLLINSLKNGSLNEEIVLPTYIAKRESVKRI